MADPRLLDPLSASRAEVTITRGELAATTNAAAWFDRPIPPLPDSPTNKGFRQYPVDVTQPGGDEPLVDALAAGLAGESFYARVDGLNAPYYAALAGAMKRVWVRRGVLERLLRVNEALGPLGIEVYLLDGYRTLECQRAVYDWFIDQARRAMPHGTMEQWRAFAFPYISDPRTFDWNDSTTWISHITGAAIDLTLRRRASGEWLYMGGVFDDPSDVSTTAHYEGVSTTLGMSAEDARRNRRLLFWAMHREGFSSLPSEWWHYDYGDQLWAKNRPRVVDGEAPLLAFYGPVPAPE